MTNSADNDASNHDFSSPTTTDNDETYFHSSNRGYYGSKNQVVSLICQTWNLKTFIIDVNRSFLDQAISKKQDKKRICALRKEIKRKLDARLPDYAFRLV